MKTIAALFVAVVLGTVAPAHALPNYVEGKDVVYAGNSLLLHVSKIDLLTSGTVWTTALAAPGGTELSLSLAKDVLYVTGKRPDFLGVVWALDSASGAILWQTTNMPGGAISSSATVDKGVLFVTSTIATTALDAETGQILWQTLISAVLPLFSSPTVDKGVVVVVSGSLGANLPVVFTMDAQTGQILSAVPLP